MSTRILTFELTEVIPIRLDLDGARSVLALLRLNGLPIGVLRIACPNGRLARSQVTEAIDQDHALRERLAYHSLRGWLLSGTPPQPRQLPSWSVIVCTRNRPAELRRCLDSLLAAASAPALPPGELLVVDNAPSGPETARLAASYPVHYLREDRPGLNWARSRGAAAASGEIVLYLDDDVVVDKAWIEAMLEPFDSPRTAAVTGLVLPLELETPAQELFEAYGGFGRGFEQRTFDYTNIAPPAAGYVGAGASMALRRELVVQLGLFDHELDCGTVTESGGDAYAFYQLLSAGYQIVYSPAALSWHAHRRDYAGLRRTIAGYSVGGFAMLTRCLLDHGDLQALGVALSWLWSDHIEQLARWLFRTEDALPFGLVLAQFAGVPKGIWAHFAARQRERSYAQPKLRLVSGLLPAAGARPESLSPRPGEQEVR